MHFKNWAVSSKIWALMLMLLAVVLCAGIGLVRYMDQMETHTRAEQREFEQRVRMAERWRAVTDLAVAHVVTGAMSRDDQLTAYAHEKVQDGVRAASEVQQALERILTDAQTRKQLEKIAQARMRVLDLNKEVVHQRNTRGHEAAQQVLRAEMLPAVAAYNQAQTELVTLLESMRDNMVEHVAEERSRVMLAGAAVLALVTALGVVMSIFVIRQITRPLEDAVRLAETIAQGDLTVDLQADRKDELGRLLQSLNTMTQRLRSVVSEVRQGVNAVNSAASEIASGNQDLSGRTEQTAASLEETAASIEQLTATVSQAADTARQASQLAATAAQAAERGGQVVGQVVHSMQQITQSSHKISDIISVIDGIAFQTNILALNAAVEAARAGEQGRGFAVVAGEVRALAQRSAEAAKEIKSLIEASVANVDVGSSQVAQAGQSMQEIVDSVRRVTDLIGEISASAHEQHEGFTQVNQAVSNLDQMTQQNAALVEESSAAATAMNEQAQRLAQVVAMFKLHPGSDAMFSTAPAPAAPPAVPPAPAARAACTPARSQLASAAQRPAAAPAAPARSAPAAAEPVAELSAPAPKAPAKAVTGAEDDWESF